MRDAWTVLVCSSHRLTGAGIAGLLRGAGHHVPPVVDSAASVAVAADAERPDVILIDSTLIEDSVEFIKRLRASAAVAVLVGVERSPLLREAMRAGAKGFLSVDVSPGQFLESINLLAEGAIVVSAEPGRLILDAVSDIKDEGTKEKLTRHEREIAILVARGASNREIGDALSVSEHTVKVGLSQILDKLDLRNRQQIAVYVAQQGMLEDISITEQAR